MLGLVAFTPFPYTTVAVSANRNGRIRRRIENKKRLPSSSSSIVDTKHRTEKTAPLLRYRGMPRVIERNTRRRNPNGPSQTKPNQFYVSSAGGKEGGPKSEPRVCLPLLPLVLCRSSGAFARCLLWSAFVGCSSLLHIMCKTCKCT